MSNTILNNNLGIDDNSISPIRFFWSAKFLDGSVIRQIDKNNKEHLFKEVKDRFDDLGYFSLINKDKSKTFTVDLINGVIFYQNHQTIAEEFLKEKKNNVRLIFFRRHKVEINEKGKEQSHTITYHLGVQWVTINNENRNLILQINGTGDFIINAK